MTRLFASFMMQDANIWSTLFYMFPQGAQGRQNSEVIDSVKTTVTAGSISFNYWLR